MYSSEVFYKRPTFVTSSKTSQKVVNTFTSTLFPANRRRVGFSVFTPTLTAQFGFSTSPILFSGDFAYFASGFFTNPVTVENYGLLVTSDVYLWNYAAAALSVIVTELYCTNDIDVERYW